MVNGIFHFESQTLAQGSEKAYLLSMAKVLEIIHHSPRIFEIRLEKEISFIPGDCVLLVDEDQCNSRPYSISSSPDDPYLGFVIRYIMGSSLPEYLVSRKPGDNVEVGPPFGAFHPMSPGPGVFIATGTGISPYLSYLKNPINGVPKLILYGARWMEDVLYPDELARNAPLKIILSGEETPYSLKGHINDHLNIIPIEPELHYYLCGHGVMIRTLSPWLELAGVSPNQIHTEIFFN